METPKAGATCPECGNGTIRGHCGPDGGRMRYCACGANWELPNLYARKVSDPVLHAYAMRWPR
jgi:hypothetical protein